jgi:hypothetical protein
MTMAEGGPGSVSVVDVKMEGDTIAPAVLCASSLSVEHAGKIRIIRQIDRSRSF